MIIESWDRTALVEQERTIGRHKYSGAPLGGKDEFDTPDFEARGPDGPVIDRDAHVRLSSGDLLGTRILRRGYSFTDGFDEVTGQRDPAQFERIQRNLSTDILNEYVVHTSRCSRSRPARARAGSWVRGCSRSQRGCVRSDPRPKRTPDRLRDGGGDQAVASRRSSRCSSCSRRSSRIGPSWARSTSS
jgi:hypothetical protein